MWFQDLWTYDFRRTEMCIIPYATQMGEISFCAYNTGVGWRQIVEKMYQNASVAEWYKEHGKHPVHANPRKSVPLRNATPVTLKIPRDGRLVEWTGERAGFVDSRLTDHPSLRRRTRAHRCTLKFTPRPSEVSRQHLRSGHGPAEWLKPGQTTQPSVDLRK